MKDTSVVFRDFDKLIVKILGNSFFGFRPVKIWTVQYPYTQVYSFKICIILRSRI